MDEYFHDMLMNNFNLVNHKTGFLFLKHTYEP